MAGMDTVELRAGALALTLSPERGGSILAFRADGFDLMRAWDGTSDDPRALASFPLVPFSGRIDQGRFAFGGVTHELERNIPPEPHAIHGDGWTSPWRLLAADGTHATLELVHDRPGAALRYRAEQRCALFPDHLAIATGVTNLGDRPMPFGLGHHPYFPKRPGTLLSAEVAGVWLLDATGIPRERAPVPIPWGFRLRRPVAELALDHAFFGWSGLARIDWPNEGRALEIEADEPFRHLVLYLPEGADFFCVEPVSHVDDGFNLMAAGAAGTGVRVLAPGEGMRGTVRLIPRPGITPL
jgi:aldose 1-epimerase